MGRARNELARECVGKSRVDNVLCLAGVSLCAALSNAVLLFEYLTERVL